MTAVVITPSLDRSWVRPLTALRARGVAAVVVLIDPAAHEQASRQGIGGLPEAELEASAHELRALRYTLAEHELKAHVLLPRIPLADQMITVGGRAGARVR